MSVMVKDSLGRWVQAAGQGKAEYGASTVRTGTYSLDVVTNSGANTTITFDTPMPDGDYIVTFQENSPASGQIGYRNCTATGFNLFVLGYYNGSTPVVQTYTGTYTAFKLYTDTEYNQVLSAFPLADSVTDGNMKAVTSNAVYDAIAAFKRKADWSGIATKNYNNKTYFVPELYEATVGGSYAGIAYVLGECNGIALFGVNGADLSGFSHVDGSMYTVEPIVINNRSYFALRMSNDTDVDVGILVLGTSYS